MALSIRLCTAETSWRRSPTMARARAAHSTSSRMPRVVGDRPQTLDGLASTMLTGTGSRIGDLLRLDPGQVEEIVDDAGEPLGFGAHALGQPGHHLRIVLAFEGLGQQAESADRASSARG